MDFATFNGLYTLFLIILFVGIILWSYSKKQKNTFEDIGNSIFSEQELNNQSHKQQGAKK